MSKSKVNKWDYFMRHYNHFLYLLYFPVTWTFYYLVEKFVQPKYTMHCGLDDKIPFIEIFILPYNYWHIYVGAFLIYFGLKSKKEYFQTIFMLYVGMTLCYIIYILFPSIQYLRPIIMSDDIFSRLIQQIYHADTNTNVFPSMHVFNTLIVHFAVLRSELLRRKKWVINYSHICAITIILSTVILKQHSFLDVIGGFVLSLMVYAFTFKNEIKEKYTTMVTNKETIRMK